VPPRLVNPEVWPLYTQRFTEILGFAPAPLSSSTQVHAYPA
jgi:D-3-phosphoglycerate dehydrogenase